MSLDCPLSKSPLFLAWALIGLSLSCSSDGSNSRPGDGAVGGDDAATLRDGAVASPNGQRRVWGPALPVSWGGW